MKDRAHVLIADDEANVRRVLGALLEEAGYVCTLARDGTEALHLVRAQDPDLLLSDLKMPGMDGLELLRLMRRDFPEIPVVLLTAHGTVENAVDAMKLGAHDFLTKPFERERVLETLAKALGYAESARREFHGPFVEDTDGGIVGNSVAVVELRRLIARVAQSPSTILITGETGTGKELVAESLHRGSDRADRPLVRINCGALPEQLIEAELFGHERGAFTGADHAKPGRFELADGGTLFLDEIGELPAAAQVKLLRVLQDGVIDRIGGTGPRRIDVRLMAATNRDLEAAVADGTFREDLLFRLNVIEIRVPPLRERTDDVPLLVEFFLDKQSRRLRRPRPSVAPTALAGLRARPWPGNVRELENAVERAVLLASSAVLEPHDFGLAAASPPGAETGLRGAARAAATDVERRLIRAALESTAGNVTQAAARLGLSRRGLQKKMKELGLRPSGGVG